jgi:dolichyl-phosphate beta-glucosyltransferase
MTFDSQTYLAYRDWVSQRLSGPPQVSVVLPAHNEEARVLATVGAIAPQMSARIEPWELIVADDRSTDATVELLEDLRFPNMTILVGGVDGRDTGMAASTGGGRSSAIRRGVTAARGEFVLVLDADQSALIRQFDSYLRHLTEDGYDIVLGSRSPHRASAGGESGFRRVFGKAVHTLVSAGFGVDLGDPPGGFLLFTRDAAVSLFALQTVEQYPFELQVQYLAGRLGLRIKEVPVDSPDSADSTRDTTRSSLHAIKDLSQIKVHDLRKRFVPGKRSTVRAAVDRQLIPKKKGIPS